eukprot:4192657-Pleurochrysis_carterae.AAC.1
MFDHSAWATAPRVSEQCEAGSGAGAEIGGLSRWCQQTLPREDNCGAPENRVSVHVMCCGRATTFPCTGNGVMPPYASSNEIAPCANSGRNSPSTRTEAGRHCVIPDCGAACARAEPGPPSQLTDECDDVTDESPVELEEQSFGEAANARPGSLKSMARFVPPDIVIDEPKSRELLSKLGGNKIKFVCSEDADYALEGIITDVWRSIDDEDDNTWLFLSLDHRTVWQPVSSDLLQQALDGCASQNRTSEQACGVTRGAEADGAPSMPAPVHAHAHAPAPAPPAAPMPPASAKVASAAGKAAQLGTQAGKEAGWHKETGKKGMGSKEAGNKEAGNKEAGSKEAGSKEAGTKEASDRKYKVECVLDVRTLPGQKRELLLRWAECNAEGNPYPDEWVQYHLATPRVKLEAKKLIEQRRAEAQAVRFASLPSTLDGFDLQKDAQSPTGYVGVLEWKRKCAKPYMAKA